MATGSRPTPRLCIKTPLTIAMIIKTPDGITASGCPGPRRLHGEQPGDHKDEDPHERDPKKMIR